MTVEQTPANSPLNAFPGEQLEGLKSLDMKVCKPVQC